MDADRARVAKLSDRRRDWPLVVRRARPGDREAVLAFASHTWDGWDYVPNAWPVWLSASDGVLLVGCVGRPPDGRLPVDHEGTALEVGRPIAVARVAMLSETEAWLEGIRVDPRVRGMDVGTDLQVAELHWAGALGASVVRYATGERNEGSHRLGARHGFALTGAFRTYAWSADEPSAGEDDDEDESGYDEAPRAAAAALRTKTLKRLTELGLVARLEDESAAWQLVSGDPTFNAGARLYEHRAWALQELTRERFARHLERGEVVLSSSDGNGRSALAVLERTVLPAEDASLHLALICGDGPAALTLVRRIQAAAETSIRFRLPESEESLINGHQEAFAGAGFRAREWTLHILARPLEVAHPPPSPVNPSALVLAEEPGALEAGAEARFASDRA